MNHCHRCGSEIRQLVVTSYLPTGWYHVDGSVLAMNRAGCFGKAEPISLKLTGKPLPYATQKGRAAA